MLAQEFIHPEDEAALKQLESIPGFPAFVKKILSLGLEQLIYGINMASSVRLSEKQMPELYRHLPPICKKLGIPEPEFYLTMDPSPNAGTFGDTRIFISVTSGLVEMMNDDELDAVLAHECGHILCRHVLYHTVADYIMKGMDSLGVLGSLTLPLQWAFLYWQRKSELSCDRVAALASSPELVSSVMARFSAGPKEITSGINMEEWAAQADEYDKIWNDGLWNKTLQMYAIANQDHPFAAVRVREVLKWAKTDQYITLKENLENGVSTCPVCRKAVNSNWMYCNYCGTKIK